MTTPWRDSVAHLLMRTMKLIWLGFSESRSDVTTHFAEEDIEWYDVGRAFGRWIWRLE